MHRRFKAVALATFAFTLLSAPVFADSQPEAPRTPSFISLQPIDVQPLSPEEMQQTSGKFALDSSINLTALVERLSPAQRGQLTQILVAAQQRGIPLPPALVSLIPNPGGVEAQGTEAQGIEQD